MNHLASIKNWSTGSGWLRENGFFKKGSHLLEAITLQYKRDFKTSHARLNTEQLF